jgi:hypothetical protein
VRQTGDLITQATGEGTVAAALARNDMDANKLLNLTVIVISTAVMLVGALVVIGKLVPVYFPEQFRIIVGVVVFLYGLYRFVLSYFRMKRREQ